MANAQHFRGAESRNGFRIGLRRVSAIVAQFLCESSFRLQSPFPSSGQRELVHPKSEIVPQPRFLTPSPDFFHAEPRRARRSEDWILSANSPSPRETSSALSPPRQKNSYQYLIEWKVAASTDTAANAFLGTQGDVWDTQEDMATALIEKGVKKGVSSEC